MGAPVAERLQALYCHGCADAEEHHRKANSWSMTVGRLWLHHSETFNFHMQDWATMGELPRKEWMESVQLVFDYFCERTPRSYVEARETSVVWNYKYAGQST